MFTFSAFSTGYICTTNYQDVQERCRQEVMEVLGDEKAAVADMPKMPYVLATIVEVPFSDVPKIPSCFIFRPAKIASGSHQM